MNYHKTQLLESHKIEISVNHVSRYIPKTYNFQNILINCNKTMHLNTMPMPFTLEPAHHFSREISPQNVTADAALSTNTTIGIY